MREGRGEEMLQINWNVTVLGEGRYALLPHISKTNSFEIVACLKKTKTRLNQLPMTFFSSCHNFTPVLLN